MKEITISRSGIKSFKGFPKTCDELRELKMEKSPDQILMKLADDADTEVALAEIAGLWRNFVAEHLA